MDSPQNLKKRLKSIGNINKITNTNNMSANNLLKIYSRTIRGKKKWIIEHWDVEGEKYDDKFKKCDKLEDAVKEANVSMQENEIEYGLDIVTK